MRFVYLQQLWSEVVDYFFQGIMGYEVMGKEGPTSTTEHAQNSGGFHESLTSTAWDPHLVSFTRFDIEIDSPVVLFPVTYRSTQFIRLVASKISVSNYFTVGSSSSDLVNWHNNCESGTSPIRQNKQTFLKKLQRLPNYYLILRKSDLGL